MNGIRMIFHENRIEYSTEAGIREEYGYDLVSSIKRSRRLLMLNLEGVQTVDTYLLIPIRVFAGQEEVRRFLDFMEEKRSNAAEEGKTEKLDFECNGVAADGAKFRYTFFLDEETLSESWAVAREYIMGTDFWRR